MSNPLIRPNDPRFQRPPLTDEEGKNLFADPDAPIPAEPADGGPVPPRAAEPDRSNLFAPPQITPDAASAPTYKPTYQTTQPHRGVLLLVIAIIGLAADGAITLAFSSMGMFAALGLVGIVPAATAWLLAQSDLRGMREGAIDASGMVLTKLSLWLGIAGIVGYFAAIGFNIIFFYIWLRPVL